MEVLLVGNTDFITKQWIQHAFPQDHVVIAEREGTVDGNDRLRIVNMSDASTLAETLTTYEFDRIVFFSEDLTPRSDRDGDLGTLRRLLHAIRNRQTQMLMVSGPEVEFTYPENADVRDTSKSLMSRALEELCLYYARTYQIEVKIIRSPYLYAPDRNGVTAYFNTLFEQAESGALSLTIVGAEALVRWNHPKYGVIPPRWFVPVLERAGRICHVDVFVWRFVAEMLGRWEREGRNLVPVSVNVSMMDINQMDVADVIGGLLKEYNVDARLLQVEITESAVAKNLPMVEGTIRKLHARGIVVLMDDFGSAYSSLNMLKDINVDVIKLDTKFIELSDENAGKGMKIIQSMIIMAKKLHLMIIAEGAQTKEQVDRLKALGCGYIQGYYFYPPLPVKQMETLLAERADGRHYWDMSCDYLHRDHVTVNGRVLLRVSALAADAFEILADGLAEISRLNVATGEYRVIKRDGVIPDPEVDEFGAYMRAVAVNRVVHPDDVGRFFADLNLPSIRERLYRQETVLGIYRSEVLAKTGVVTFAVIPTHVCSPSDPWAVVLVGQNLSMELLTCGDADNYRRDSLTGLLNRNAYDDDLEYIQATHDQPLTVVYVDMIGLHEINNHLGHAKGDSALCGLANAMRACFGDDRIYRVGGDEFVIISCNHTVSQSMRRMERMRRDFLEGDWDISVGMAESDDGEDLSDLINQAEIRMRQDKKQYYVNGGGKRQLRMLNNRLEDILVRDEDMKMLLEHLNVRYPVSFIVNLNTDTQRSIMVPDFFQRMLDGHGGSFREALREFCCVRIAPEYQEGLLRLLDYDVVRSRLKSEGAVQCGYVKNNGERFMLTILTDNRSTDETMWVFERKDLP